MKTLTDSLCLVLILIVSGCGTVAYQKPLIGVTSAYRENSNLVRYDYITAIEHNGGIPVILPTVKNDLTIDVYIAKLDGLLLIGGKDIPPSAYNELPHPTVDVMPEERYQLGVTSRARQHKVL